MSHVTRLTDLSIDHEVMEPILIGDSDLYYRERQIEQSHPFRCDGCGLVWAKRWYAETCESRNHRSEFDQIYTYRLPGFHVHGRTEQKAFTRYALKRDRRIAERLATTKES